jgi:phosphomannomutase
MPQHIFFDLDNTLMLSRTTMATQHQALFKKLCDQKDVIVVSGAQESQIRTQIPEEIGASYFVLGQTGNHAVGKDTQTLWKETFTDEQTRAALDLIETIKNELQLSVKDPNDLVELRGSQISYSPIGHHEDLEKKYAFDPGATKRLTILTNHSTDVDHLRSVGIDVVPGGTTCFDFFLAGKNKGYNVMRLIELQGWNKDECLYIGDALFPGGNDETVIGVIPTHAVKNPDETFRFIEENLLS